MLERMLLRLYRNRMKFRIDLGSENETTTVYNVNYHSNNLKYQMDNSDVIRLIKIVSWKISIVQVG